MTTKSQEPPTMTVIDVNAEIDRVQREVAWDQQPKALITLLHRVRRERDNAVEEIRALHAEAQPCAAS